ncbi:hypothetical protein MASSI9I_51181 [Massilia sp. 9I]|nr:hypothetical protein MASSI9I_51181 [Massilia sp. 9I]
MILIKHFRKYKCELCNTQHF